VGSRVSAEVVPDRRDHLVGALEVDVVSAAGDLDDTAVRKLAGQLLGSLAAE
jgi:hypothetical protein